MTDGRTDGRTGVTRNAGNVAVATVFCSISFFRFVRGRNFEHFGDVLADRRLSSVRTCKLL